MKRKIHWLVLALVLCLTTSAWAHWDPSQPAKWVQFPDLSTMGIDVNASYWYILADDFECTETGPITDFHIWGSWRGDMLPFNDDPNAVTFTLSLHSDIPASQNPNGYSQPGDLLWLRTFHPGEFTSQIWRDNIEEGWMDAPDVYQFPGDWTCWQYNFVIDDGEYFIQQGTPDEPKVYWLNVQAQPQDSVAVFGWKTSVDHWNDKAVWVQAHEPYVGDWFELWYPPGHEMQGMPIDLAFVITGEVPEELDFGDAPDPAGAVGYQTWLANDGARHVIAGPWLGDASDAPDPEPDGQPNSTATGDDLDGNDDEDGVNIPTLIQAALNTITFTVSGGGGFVEGWIDLDGSGTWDAAEQVIGGMFADGTHSFNVTPTTPYIGQTFARFRISGNGTPGPAGWAADGEVEDYEVFITEFIDELDFGDAPDSPVAPGYPTLNANGGASHVLGGSMWLGPISDMPDPEPDGQPDANATGDDLLDGFDDENGVILPIFQLGQNGNIQFTVTGGGEVQGWIDWNSDQIWGGAELVVTGFYGPGTYTVPVTCPNGATVGQTFARFRISSMAGLPPTGPAPDGEVEDYQVFIEEDMAYKWIQPPDLDVTGIDVNATQEYILADDFLCTQQGYINEIYVWGSWLDDYIPFQEDPRAVTFQLSIHADIPATATDYSRPGDVLWLATLPPGSFEASVHAAGIEEGWMDPPDGYFFPADWTCWLYKFSFDDTEAFFQQGTTTDSVVYWLDVQAIPEDQNARFGWKTSIDHWNDDAVWGMGVEPYFGPWFELVYPPNHQWHPESIDLAFALVGSGSGEQLDFGDAPELPYPTLLPMGANHVIVPGIFLGNLIDSEPNGQPHPGAQGDDLNNLDDEDGVIFTSPLNPGGTATITVIASTNGVLDGWIDFNNDGSWATPGDQIFMAQFLAAGPNVLNFNVPTTGTPGATTFARFRFNAGGTALPFTGPAPDGEVEDYRVYIEDDLSAIPDEGLPERFGLEQNVPNPFNPMTSIHYDLPKAAVVELSVYTLDGRHISTLVNEQLPAGRHTVIWNGRNDAGMPVASGTYIYRIKAGDFVASHNMLLIK